MKKKTLYIVGGATAVGIIIYLLWRKKKKTNESGSGNGGGGGVGAGTGIASLFSSNSSNTSESSTTSSSNTSNSGTSLLLNNNSGNDQSFPILTVDQINFNNLVGQSIGTVQTDLVIAGFIKERNNLINANPNLKTYRYYNVNTNVCLNVTWRIDTNIVTDVAIINNCR